MITLVMMPFSDIERPSLALGLLRAALVRAGLAAEVVYANLLFVREFGLQAASLPLRQWGTSLLGEWVFAGAAFPGFHPDDDRYLEECLSPFARFHSNDDPALMVRALKAELRRLRAAAPDFIERLAQDLLARRPSLVACSSSYFQQTASLALLRRVRELAPAVATMIGGANVEGTMGAAVLESFPWVDAVFSGEADEAIVPVCRAVQEQGRAGLAGPLPDGLASRLRPGLGRGAFPCAMVRDLDALPMPDYDEYFAALDRLPASSKRLVQPVLPMETSRGCHWGKRRPCTFCGLNGARRDHRVKSAERALAELDFLADRHGLREFAMADNMMPMEYRRSLCTQLEARQAPYRLFYQIRPTLHHAEVRGLWAAGIRHMQAGIESLDTDHLALMRKGTTILGNVALLKHACEFGLVVAWHVLTGLPGECDDWYDRMARWMPLIHHLQPPESVHGITLQRFSPYYEDASGHGLSPVVYQSYEAVYPPQTARADLACHFRDSAWPEFYPEMNRRTPALGRLLAAVEAWRRRYWSPTPPRLVATERGDGSLDVVDTRRSARERRRVLLDLPARLCRLARDPLDEAALPYALADQGCDVTPAALAAALDELLATGMVLRSEGRLLALATPESRRPAAPSVAEAAAVEAFRSYLSELVRGN